MIFLAKEIEVNMFVGIRDFEYKDKQKVLVNVKGYGGVPFKPKDINECLDYSKICDYVKLWENRPHVDLIETLLSEVVEFCFQQDKRIFKLEVEILKPEVIQHTKYVGVAMAITREEFNLLNRI